MHKSQIFFYLLLSFLFGVGLASFLTIPNIAWHFALVASFVLIVFFWPMRTSSKFSNLKIRKWKYVFYVFLIVFFIIGALKTNLFRLNHGILNEFADKKFNTLVRGYIDGEVENLGNYQKFVFRAKEFELPKIRAKIDEKILITTQAYPEHFYGDKLEIMGELKSPQNYEGFDSVRSNPPLADADMRARRISNGVDYKRFLAKDQIFTTMAFSEINETDIRFGFKENLKLALFQKIFALKNQFKKSIQKSIPEPNAAFIGGILLGSRESIPQDLKEDFSKTGTTHILAISGYNITILAGVVSWFFLLFFSRKSAFWYSVIAIFLFTIITGASASVTRAAIMGLLVLLAQNSGRLYDSRNALILAASAMVWFNPMVLRFDIGFQLSFLATIGILFVAPIFEKHFQKLPKLLNFRGTFLMTLSAQIMVLPLILFYFQNLSLISLPANLLVLPLIPYAMLLGFLSGIGGIVWDNLGFIIGLAAWLITSFEILMVRFFASIPYSLFEIAIPWYGVMVLYFLLIYGLKILEDRFR